jgi:MFS family permease
MNFNFKKTFRTLENRNFKLYFFGQILSTIGTFMQAVALGWLVYRLTNSPLLLGLVGFASQFPSLIIGPFGGLIADRWNRLKIYLGTQILSMIQAFVLAYVVLSGQATVWHLVILGFILGLIAAVDFPVRQALLTDIIENKKDLNNAIPLNSTFVHVARFIGPAIAGFLVAFYGEGICFLINGISFLAVIVALLAIRLPEKSLRKREFGGLVAEMKDGYRYVANSFVLRSSILIVAIVSLIGMSYFVLFPIFARDVLHGDAKLLGFLSALSGAGSLIGTIYLASREKIRGLESILAVFLAVLSIGMIIFGISHTIALSLIAVFLMGFATTVILAAARIMLQFFASEDKMGRVMGYYTLAFVGITPISSLLAGILAEKIGASGTVIWAAVAMAILLIFFLRKMADFKKNLEPVYVRIDSSSEITSIIEKNGESPVPREE